MRSRKIRPLPAPPALLPTDLIWTAEDHRPPADEKAPQDPWAPQSRAGQ